MEDPKEDLETKEKRVTPDPLATPVLLASWGILVTTVNPAPSVPQEPLEKKERRG